jgi:hypothetical protein
MGKPKHPPGERMKIYVDSAGGFAGRSGEQVGAGDQCADRQDASPHCAVVAARHRRRSD